MTSLLQKFPEDIDQAFAAVKAGGVEMLQVLSSPVFARYRSRLIELATQENHLLTMFIFKSYVTAGGLISYGASRAENIRLLARYAINILKGAKPADLPVVQPTKFELVINLKTAKTLGLDLPPSLLARADEVIE